MPKPVAEPEHADAVVLRQRILVLVQVGDIRHLPVDAARFGLLDVAHLAGNFQRAEIAREGFLLLVGKVLIVEHQDGVLVHARLDRCDVLRRQRFGQIDTIDFTADGGTKRTDGNGHCKFLRKL